MRYGINGNNGVPSCDTPCVTALSNSPSVHEPIPAGVMFFAYNASLALSANFSPPTPSDPGLTGPENFVQSRWLWHSVHIVT